MRFIRLRGDYRDILAPPRGFFPEPLYPNLVSTPGEFDGASRLCVAARAIRTANTSSWVIASSPLRGDIGKLR
jgi:hypothetical protein